MKANDGGFIKRRLRRDRDRLRALFQHEWAWRAFVVLCVASVLSIVALDLSQPFWDLFPERRRDWDVFEARHWRLHGQSIRSKANWILLALLAGPFLIAKAADWIAAGRKQ